MTKYPAQQEQKTKSKKKAGYLQHFNLNFFPLIFVQHFTIKIKKEILEFYNYLTLG